ncbi:MAG: ATP-dependent sacrificial sulfur transferase LarE [Deltaproteobacteria bacterium]|nr:ATP-dependent sacrificial sulfur transferase LarE [Deltaproteobacteria bacterium]
MDYGLRTRDHGLRTTDYRGGTTDQERLEKYIAGLGRAVVAFSGGVDSGLLAYLARRQLGKTNTIALTGDSASVPSGDRLFVVDFCREHDIPHQFIATHEQENPDYLANPDNRCFFCKEELYRRLRDYAAQNNFDHILDGTNATDLKGHRPGYAALTRAKIRAPYVVLGMGKEKIRLLAEHFDLAIAAKPQSACLASRIPTGTPVDLDALKRIDEAEKKLRALGFANPRVRFHGNLARLQLAQKEWGGCLRKQNLIQEALRPLGFDFITLDLKAYDREG